VPPEFVGKTLAELEIRKRYQVLVVAIKRGTAGHRHRGRRGLQARGRVLGRRDSTWTTWDGSPAERLFG
jgi:Trk K+ transport system NAD-binding subunit